MQNATFFNHTAVCIQTDVGGLERRLSYWCPAERHQGCIRDERRRRHVGLTAGGDVDPVHTTLASLSCFAMKLREIIAKKSALSLSLRCLSYFSSCFCLLIQHIKQMQKAFAHRETRFCYYCESYQLLIIFYLVLL